MYAFGNIEPHGKGSQVRQIHSMRIHHLLGLMVLFLWTVLGPPPFTQAREPVMMAVILARTGIAAEDNRPAIRAAQVALDEVNEAGGLLGRPVKMTLIDNGSTPIGSKHAAQRAKELEATAVIGPFWSSHALQTAAVLQAARIPMITPTATKPEITRNRDYVFRVCSSDAFQGRVMAHFAFQDLEARTALVLKNISETYPITLAGYFKTGFESAGGKVLWEGEYTGKAVNFQCLLERAKSFQADVWFIPGYARDSGLLIKQAVSLGVKTTFLGGDGWGENMREYAGEVLEGAYYSTHYHPDLPFPKNRHLHNVYREQFGRERIVDVRIPLTYDALHLIAHAVKRAGSAQGDCVRKALAATKGFSGATGTISFDADGDPENKEMSILRFEKDHSVFIKSVSPQ